MPTLKETIGELTEGFVSNAMGDLAFRDPFAWGPTHTRAFRRHDALPPRSYGIWLPYPDANPDDPFGGNWYAIADRVFATESLGEARAQLLYLIKRGEPRRRARIMEIGDSGLPKIGAYIPGELPSPPESE